MKVRSIWDALSGPSRASPDMSLPAWLFLNISDNQLHSSGFHWSLIFGVACWVIWLSRNEVILHNTSWDVASILHRIWRTVKDYVVRLSCIPSTASRQPLTKHVGWTPSQGWVKWNLDGSVVSHGAGASSGCVLRDDMGRWLTGAIRNIGQASITIAELWAFKDATHLSLARGDNSVWFESDSIIAVNFINKGVPYHHPCFGIVSSIRSNLAKIPRFLVSHIYWEGNFVADGLAHLAHSYALGFHPLPNPLSLFLCLCFMILRGSVSLGCALFSGALSPPL
ncbi:Ribonuclease H-like superfamily [Sesbania bispinosa]|nr:Ribonuclease H-like superfamily [Sesbania bispinosa]